MASIFTRTSNTRLILQIKNGYLCSKLYTSGNVPNQLSRASKILISGGLIGTGLLGLGFTLNESVKAAELSLHPPSNPWYHNGILRSIDIASVRRGWEVYKTVCAACHSLKYVAYREFVDVLMTEEEAKEEAVSVQVQDGPDDKGNMFMRDGKLSDYIPGPYKNDEEAKAMNNGSLPPDLSLITLARHGGEDYVFSLLTGYCEAPAGITIQDGQHFNPYFQGGAIAMAQSLYNEILEYKDGTPATASQMAKDVCAFLHWSGQSEWNDRKMLIIKTWFIGGALILATWYYKRHVWTILKNRKIIFKELPKRN